MPIIFLLGAAYCVIRAMRCFMNKRPPMYVEKDPDVTASHVAEWNRNTGYSMLFWAAFAATVAAYMAFGLWLIFIPMALLAAGGVVFSMRASAALRKKGGDTARKPGGGVSRKKKKRKKK